MDILNIKNKQKARKSRLKTICTLDTYDVNLGESSYGKENRSRNGTHLIDTQKQYKKKKGSTHINKSIHSIFQQSRLKQTTTPKSLFKRAMSINTGQNARIKTDYSEYDQSGVRKIMGSLKKRLLFPVDDNYKIEAFEIIRKINQTQDQKYFQIKSGAKKSIKNVMIKTKNIQKKREYEKQMKIVNSLSNLIKQKEQKVLLKISNIYKQKKEWIIITEQYCHASWQNDKYYLFLNQFKNNYHLIKKIVKTVAHAISIVSFNGLAHSNIGIESIYFPIFKGQLKIGQIIKVGGFANSTEVDNKELLMTLPIKYRTPPQIINLIAFQNNQMFDREHLQYITQLNEGWKADVWALGILVLELLNGGLLTEKDFSINEMIQFQKELLIRYSYLLCNLDCKLKALLTCMLSFNPDDRPHPREIQLID